MAEIFYFYVQDDRTITFHSPEPIMQEDKDVAVWKFRIPKVLNQIDMSNWAWWFVYTNAKGQKFSKELMLGPDYDEPDTFNSAEISIDHGISIYPGNITFALEAIEAIAGGGEIIGEWHTYTYTHKVIKTLQGNQAEYAETEHDIISALITEYQNLHVGTNQITDGAVTFAKLANDAITSVKIANGAVTNGKLASNSVSTVKVQDGAITEAKMAGGSVTKAKLASDSVSSDKVQDGAITEKKLASDIYLDKYKNLSAIPAPDILLLSIGIDYTAGYTMQGACFNSDNNHILIAFHKSGDPICILKELDSNWNLIKTASLALYHANDITYNPKSGLYYVADGENSNTIYSVDSALTAVTAITVNVGGAIGQISYDEDNDRYYLLNNSREVYTCDGSFGNVSYYATLNTANDYPSIQTIYIGGSCMIGDTFVSQLWFYSTYDQVTSYTRLCLVNADKDYDGYYFDFRSHAIGNESESLIGLSDKIVSVGYVDTSIVRTYIYKNGYQAAGMTCLIGNTYRNVNYVPVNSYGVCTILASSSPTNEDITGAYICYGTNQNKTLRITVNDTDYYRYCYGQQQWTAWHSNKEILNSLIVSQSLTIASGVDIAAGASSPEYTVNIPAKTGYIPFCVTHRSVSAPVIFLWYMYLETNSTSESGYRVRCRYRNTGTSQQTNQNIDATVYYVRTA